MSPASRLALILIGPAALALAAGSLAAEPINEAEPAYGPAQAQVQSPPPQERTASAPVARPVRQAPVRQGAAPASEPEPDAAAQEAAPENADPAAFAALRFTTLEISAVQPETPTAGQVAQVQFRALSAPTPLAREARLFTSAEQDALHRLLRERLRLLINGVEHPIENIKAPAEFDSGRAMLVGTFRLGWPATRPGVAALGFPATIVHTVQLRDTAAPQAETAERIVESRVQTDGARLLTFLVGLFAVLSVLGWLAWRTAARRERGRAQPRLIFARTPGSEAPSQEVSVQPESRDAPPGRLREPLAPGLIPRAPESLASALAEGQAMLVLGTGASAQGGLPSAQEILLELIETLAPDLPSGLTYILEEADPAAELVQLKTKLGGFPKIMDVILSAVPRERVIASMYRQLGDTSGGSRLHSGLAELPWRGLVALAWDKLADRIFYARRPRELPPLRTFTMSDSAELTTALRSGDALLLRALGDLDRPVSLSLSIEEFRRNLVRAPEFQRGLSSLLQSNAFLFIGVGVETLEPFLQAVAPELQASEARHYALLPEDRTNEVWGSTLARFGVHILSYDADPEHGALIAFQEDLRQQVRALLAGRSSPVQERSTGLSHDAITTLRLTNIGPFESLSLDFPVTPGDSPAGTPRPWSVIFGGNGVGKSSILRAIALVLSGDHPAAAGAGRRLLRTGAGDGLIELQVGSRLLKTRLIRDGSRVETVSLQHTPVQTGAALVMGFSALRGARAPEPGGPSTGEPVHDPEPSDLLPLLNGEVDGRLGDFKQWLINVMVQAADGSNPRAVAMRDLLDRIIRDIVPGEVEALAPLDTKDFVIRVRTADGDVPFDDLSQGMASIFNWIGVLAQRQFDICSNSAAPNLEPAIVLIDEVDAHLHPDWQRRLVELTRRHFPNVQVIASSHSPLLAGALHEGEVQVLERNPETGIVAPLGVRIDTFGMPSQTILTSAVFGMLTDRNPHVERLIKDYFRIFQKAKRSTEEEAQLAEMKLELDRYRYGEPAQAPFVADVELGDAEIEALRRRLGSTAEAAEAALPLPAASVSTAEPAQEGGAAA